MADGAALLLLVGVAFLVESALGFGASVIVATVGALLGPLDRVMPAFITANVFLSAWVTATARAHVDRALLLREVLPLVGAGLGAGMLLAAQADRPAARIAFGAGVALLAAHELRRALAPAAHDGPLPRPAASGLLALGGVVHGIFGAGGPLVVLVVGRRATDKRVFRATLSALWLILNAALVARWALDGTWTAATARDTALLAPALLLGGAGGAYLHRALPPRSFRVTAAAVMGAAGLSLATRTLFAA